MVQQILELCGLCLKLLHDMFSALPIGFEVLFVGGILTQQAHQVQWHHVASSTSHSSEILSRTSLALERVSDDVCAI